jgi:hypothetical protein
MSYCSEGEQLLRGSKRMVRIPIRSRVPMQAWAVAGFITIVSAISSLLGKPDASVGLDWARAVECTPRSGGAPVNDIHVARARLPNSSPAFDPLTN